MHHTLTEIGVRKKEKGRSGRMDGCVESHSPPPHRRTLRWGGERFWAEVGKCKKSYWSCGIGGGGCVVNLKGFIFIFFFFDFSWGAQVERTGSASIKSGESPKDSTLNIVLPFLFCFWGLFMISFLFFQMDL